MHEHEAINTNYNETVIHGAISVGAWYERAVSVVSKNVLQQRASLQYGVTLSNGQVCIHGYTTNRKCVKITAFLEFSLN